MDDKTLFLQFWDKEAAATRKVLSRIPEGSTYRPNPEIADRTRDRLVDRTRGAGARGWLGTGDARMARGRGAGDDEGSAGGVRRAARDGDEEAEGPLDRELEGKVPFMYQGQEVMSESGSGNAWGFFFDIIHHRGQLSTYLRPMGAKVPQIYGPSADEPMS